VINPYIREAISFLDYQKTWDIPNALPVESFDVTSRPVHGRILVAGRIIPRKNVLTAIRAFAITRAHCEHATLHLAGDGDPLYMTRCRELVRKLGLSPAVRFMGALSPSALRGEFAQAELLLVCSLQETAPMVIAEAMAAGTPVVTANAGGARFMVNDGICGTVVSRTDPHDLSAAMIALLSTPHRRAVLGREARKVALATYHPDVVGAATYKVYQELANR
jgi:glycosyltransferase involved in cell wall biosynthesis